MRCNLCPRACRVDRIAKKGFCGAGPLPLVAKAMLHRWEEPCLSGERGSGTVFFSGCNLGCVFCQNYLLQDGALGRTMDAAALSDLFLSLQARGAHNISLVTPTPHIPVIREALIRRKCNGLTLPVVYNTSSYERASALRSLSGLVDIYLPDLKYVSPVLSARFSGAADYFSFAAPAIREMYRQVGDLTTDTTGMALKGLMIRHLVLPCCVDDTRRVLDHIADAYPLHTHVSLMCQYTPTVNTLKPPLNRRITRREYDRAVTYALDLGFTNLLLQQESSADPSFTPDFTQFQ